MKFLLIGQGIAGTMLADALQKRGARVVVADGNLPGHSSMPAAGIINPVTGKRFVKSWRFDSFYPAAQQAYMRLGQELGIDIWSGQSILRLLTRPEEVNDWSARCALPDYATHLSETDDAGAWQAFIKPALRYGIIERAARVDFPALIGAFRQKLRLEGAFVEENIAPDAVESLAGTYDGIVFCEGYRGQENPFFPGLPWQLAKGEALLLRFRDHDGSHISRMLKKTMTLVPLGGGLFWAGGSYQWHYPDLLPSAGERAFILHHLNEMIAAPFDIVDHVAGVRPTVKDRRPFIGRSSIHPGVFMFNGLGTKGALLAPFWAGHFADCLLKGEELDEEVSIRRF